MRIRLVIFLWQYKKQHSYIHDIKTNGEFSGAFCLFVKIIDDWFADEAHDQCMNDKKFQINSHLNELKIVELELGLALNELAFQTDTPYMR